MPYNRKHATSVSVVPHVVSTVTLPFISNSVVISASGDIGQVSVGFDDVIPDGHLAASGISLDFVDSDSYKFDIHAGTVKFFSTTALDIRLLILGSGPPWQADLTGTMPTRYTKF